jgi:phage terminase large subunit-like protein
MTSLTPVLPPSFSGLSREAKLEALSLLEEKERRRRVNKLREYYPDEGPLRRELYPRHLAFFAAGVVHHERLALCANRVGKTEGMGGYELAIHLTGQYPHWWPGRRFQRPISAWAAGTTRETTRDILQGKLMGPRGEYGTGLLPASALGRYLHLPGVPDGLATVQVKHASGGWSHLGFKSFDQGRKAFEGTEQDVVWLDEEPSMDIYTECITRTMTNDGMVMLTFTPLQGMSEVVLSFLPGGNMPGADGGELV